MKARGISALELTSEGLALLDQRLLPHREEYVLCRTCREVAAAIKDMVVRGAPAIGIAAAYGMYLAAREALGGGACRAGRPGEDGVDAAGERLLAVLENAGRLLKETRPTAVNLSWAVDRMEGRAQALKGSLPLPDLVEALRDEALCIHREDVEMNRRIGRLGAALVSDGDVILTHCNAGALATGGYGTALGVIRAAHEQGKRIHVMVDETRPFLQGARLTAWELMRECIPFTLITDNMAGHFMRLGRVSLVVVGADRIAANGDVANKVGTYMLAVLARENGVPFFVAAPWSTVDMSLDYGDRIVIEERDSSEVTGYGACRWAPEGVDAANPAFDVTPARFISGIITDRGIAWPPFRVSLAALAIQWGNPL